MAQGLRMPCPDWPADQPPSPLTGHDTSYSPDDDNVNPREDFTHSDANEAVHQPSFRPVLTLGISRSLRTW
ncbi:MAG: hypothetical protein PVI31_02035 [Gemmatimonadota bacterium]|jgi:hypothetical protein